MAIARKKAALPSGGLTPTAAATAILDVAEELAQTRGYNGFSYADIAVKLGVTKASLHYHFPSKAELGRVLIERYRIHFGAALLAIDEQARDALEKLKRYVALYSAVLSNERMCLCGMLAAEQATLPLPMREALRLFFTDNERWLTAVLDEGRQAGILRFKASTIERARVLLAQFEGAMLVARSYGEPLRFHSAASYVLADLSTREQSRPGRRS